MLANTQIKQTRSMERAIKKMKSTSRKTPSFDDRYFIHKTLDLEFLSPHKLKKVSSISKKLSNELFSINYLITGRRTSMEKYALLKQNSACSILHQLLLLGEFNMDALQNNLMKKAGCRIRG
ncbi:10128_t:CDS:2 [Funneliformis mosseae]|uniref:10128_t:CDS:1 n=1 Tax=Funneliformis mosseae TaxID=27381 RepID=A0A9N9G3X6_FUNMO|nr:10128_t:CDS:2 [Funneliformis mosseae]